MNCNKITKIHRRYPDRNWDFKALSCRTSIGGKPTDVVYGTLKSEGKFSKSVEVYQGSNYIIGSNSKSYSRRYNLNKVPSNIKPIVQKLESQHKKTHWSSKKEINLN